MHWRLIDHWRFIAIGLLILFLSGRSVYDPAPTPSNFDDQYEWISMDPHVHTKAAGTGGCPTQGPVSKEQMREFGLRHYLQLVIDNYWGANKPSSEDLRKFPLPFVEHRSAEERIHGNNHHLHLSYSHDTGLPDSTNLLDGLEVSWFLSDRGSHLGILGAKSLDWFFDGQGNDKLKTAVEILEALHHETSEHNRQHKHSPNNHFVIISHMFQWNPRGYPQIAKQDFGRHFELPVTVGLERYNVKGLGTERLYSSPEAGENMFNSPIDTSTFDALTRLANSGFKMSVVGESDYACLAPDDPEGPPGNGLGKPGVLRTLVGAKKDKNGAITYQSVLDAALAGRLIATDLPIQRPQLAGFTLHFEGAEARLGETLKVASHGKPVMIEVKNVPANTSVLVNGGEAIRNTRGKLIRELKSGRQRTGSGLIEITQSSWVVASTPHELANPIYIELDDKPVRVSSEDPCFFIGFIERAKKELVRPARGDVTISDYPEDKKAYLLKKYDEAEQVYVRRFQEARTVHGGPSLDDCRAPLE